MGVFADAVVPYAQAGWPCILPVPPDTKHPPPVGFTGAEGRDTTPADLVRWAATLPDHSVALRMPDGVIGIDVDHYDKGEVRKRGGDQIRGLEEKLGPLPPTWVSSARPAPSGIRFYRVPAGRYRTKLGDSIEIIQRHHRYAVVAPSPHAAAGDVYRWHCPSELTGPVDESGLPRIEWLPELPEAWVEHLREGATEAGPAAADVSSGAALLRELEADDREECAAMYSARLKALEAMRSADSGSRHDTATERVMAVVMLGAQGHQGAGTALAEIAETWSTEIAPGEGREEEHARRALTAARKAVTEWGERQVPADPCLMAGAVEVARPAADLGTLARGVADVEAGRVRELPEVTEEDEPPARWSVREVIGAGPFDPIANLDLTLAAAVLERMAPALRYAEDAETWLRRGPELWEPAGKDYAGTVVAQLAQLMPAGSPDAEKGSEEANRAARRARFMTSSSAGAIAKQMVALARAPESTLRVRLSELDSEPWVLWAGGQAWDLRGTELSELDTDPGTPHLHAAAVRPEPRDTPLWDAFLAEVWPDPELRAWALRVLSISLTGYPDAALPILLGEPGLGKTSVIKLIMSVLGSYAHAADPRLLADTNAHASIVYALKGRRLSFVDEGPRRGRWATERLKQLTGGGELTGNRMRENPITFSPTHTLILTANEEPQLTDEGLRRRVRLIPCEGDAGAVRATRSALGPIGGAAWRREAPGILAQLMREAGLWLSDPDSALTSAAPAGVRELADEIGREQDTVRTWVESETEPSEEGTRAMALYEAFAEWCRRLQIRDVPSVTVWGRRLTDLGYPRINARGAKLRPLRLAFGGALVGGGLPLADRAQVTPTVTPASPGRDLVSGLSPVVSGSLSQPETGVSAGRPSSVLSTVSGSPVYSLFPPQDTHNPPTQKTGGKGSFAPTGDTQARERGVTCGNAVSPVVGEPETRADDRSQEGNVAGQPPSAPRKGRLTPEEKAQRAEAARAKRAAAAEEKRLTAVEEAQGPRAGLPAAVDRTSGAVRTVTLLEAADLIRAVTARSGAMTVDVETSGYPVGHRLHALRTVQLGDALECVVLDGTDPAHLAVARTAFDEAPRLHAHSATADLIPLAHAGVLDAS